MKRKLTVFLVGLAALVGLTVAAQPAGATGYFYTCPTALQAKAFKCTWVDSTVNVLDRTTGTVKTLHYNNTVGMGHWSTDTGTQCGVNGDWIVWAIWWLDGNGVKHWAVIGDWYLFTGTLQDWGPQAAEWTGTYHYNPDMRAASNGSGPCNGPNWANLGIGG